MIKIIELDKLFDNYISGYVYKNIGKVKPEEIENKIPVLYNEFGDQKLKELDGKTPNTYYKSFPIIEQINALKEHINKHVDVSDFLIESIKDNEKAEDILVDEINKDNDEEFVLYALNILNDLNSKKGIKRYLEFILWDYSEVIKELSTEILGNFADDIKEEILLNYKDADEKVKEYLTDILSKASKDDRIFDILIEQFVKHQDEIPLYAGYLGKFGDERALPFLQTAISNEKLNYADFEELRFAIESLGGEYKESRDFSSDKVYKIIKNSQNKD